MSNVLVLSSSCQGRLGMAGLALCSIFLHPLEAMSAVLDVDKNGVVDATDGVLILRRLNGASTLDTGVQLPSGQTNATIIENIDAIRFDAVGGASTSVKPSAATSSPSTVPATTTSIKPTGTSSLTTTSSSTTSSSTTSSVSTTTTSVPVNTPPVAFFSVTPPSGDTATKFNINASGSSDKEDAFGTLQFRWDWNNDGVWEQNYSSEANWNLTFPAATTANIKLEVKDSGGLTSTYTKQINISARVTTTTSTSSVKTTSTTTSIAASTCTNFAGNYLVSGTITSNMENDYCDPSETVTNESGVIKQTGCAVSFTGDGTVYNGTANTSNSVSVVASSYESGMPLNESYTFNKTTGKLSGSWSWGYGLCTGSVNFTLTKMP
ncbi:MAG: hypothetical protein H7839_09620 [Magnetococcus sp. YQC-5]